MWVDQDDHAFARRLARYCARNPVALERLTYDAGAQQVRYRSDKSDGPTAGSETVEALEFLARVLRHIPDKGQVTTRYSGWYANRPRGTRRRQAERAAGVSVAVVVAPAVPLALREVRRRWADLLRLLYAVDPLVCVRCGGAMRVVAIITARDTIDEILAHVRARSPPGRGTMASPLRSRLPTPTAAPAA